MALNISYIKVLDVPVSPDSISQGSKSLVTANVIMGNIVTDVSVNLKTYTFDLKGINEAKAQEIITVCDFNTEELLKANIDVQDLTGGTGQGIFQYRNATCLPIAYQDGGIIKIGNETNNYSSFQVTVLTDILVGAV